MPIGQDYGIYTFSGPLDDDGATTVADSGGGDGAEGGAGGGAGSGAGTSSAASLCF